MWLQAWGDEGSRIRRLTNFSWVNLYELFTFLFFSFHHSSVYILRSLERILFGFACIHSYSRNDLWTCLLDESSWMMNWIIVPSEFFQVFSFCYFGPKMPYNQLGASLVTSPRNSSSKITAIQILIDFFISHLETWTSATKHSVRKINFMNISQNQWVPEVR